MDSAENIAVAVIATAGIPSSFNAMDEFFDVAHVEQIVVPCQ